MNTASLTLTGSVTALSAALAAFAAANGNAAPPPITLPDSTDSDGEIESDGTGLDAEGLPWDERIHSSSKKKNAKGVWVARKGGPKGGELAAVKDELRGVTPEPVAMPVSTAEPEVVATPMPLPTSVSMPTPEPVAMPLPTPVPMPMPTSTAEPEVVATPMPVPTTIPTSEPVAAPAAPQPVSEEWDFAKLMAQIGPKMGTVIDPTYLAAVCQRYGLNAITDSATKPEVIGQLVAQFQADNRW